MTDVDAAVQTILDGLPDDHEVEVDLAPGDPDGPEAGELAIPASFEDAHVAEALAAHLAGRWLYLAEARRWHRWDGRRWAHDTTEQIHETARRWVIELGSQLFRQGAAPSDLSHCAKYRNGPKLDAALTMARRIDGIAASVAEFDADPDLLNARNGVVDLRTGDLLAHDPVRRITRLADADYRPDAEHPDVAEVLSVVAADVLPWLARLLGYGATGHTSEDVVPVLDGTGANGKTTLLEAVGKVLGDYAGAASPQLVMHTTHDQHPTVKADLMGRRLVWISETEEGGAFRVEAVKALTGGDQISARFMRGDFFTFTPTHMLMIATNHRPRVNTTEHAAWRRLRLVPFPHTFRSADEAGSGDRVIDPRLRRRLTIGADQRAALLAWIVRGAVDWNTEGLGSCPLIDAATSSWRRTEDVLRRFIEDTLDLGQGGQTRGSELYAAYTSWCQTEGRKSKNNKNFAAEFMAHELVVEAGVTKVSPQRIALYREVGIRDNGTF